MTVKDILLIESNNTGSINLIKDGVFWRAYNCSSMRLCEQFRPYKISHRHIKKVNETIYYCGFPDNSLDALKKWSEEKGYKTIQINDKHLQIKNLYKENEDYETWKQQFAQAKMDIAYQVNESAIFYTKTNRAYEDSVIKRIREFPLENSTPMQTMLFVQQIKKYIKDGSL